MITAKEARDIAITGLPALDAKLEEVGKQIEYAAASGLFETSVRLKHNEINYASKNLILSGYQYSYRDDTRSDGTTEVIVSWYEDGRCGYDS